MRALSLLYALTGCFDAPGGNVRPSRPAVNDLAPLALLPERQRAKALGLAGRPLGPARQGWPTAADAYRAMLHGAPYPVRGMVGFGTNLLLSAPGAATARAALTSLDFLVYADLFLTPTAALADVVLPVSTAWEREGLRVGFGPTQDGEQHVQLRPAVVAPRGEARSDIWIVCELARRLGLGERFWGGDEDAGHRFMLEPVRRHSRAAPRQSRRRAHRHRAALQALRGPRRRRPGRLRHAEPPGGDLLRPAPAARPVAAARVRRARGEPGQPPRPRGALSAAAHHRQGRAVLPQPAPEPGAPAPAQPGPAGRAAPGRGRRPAASRATTGC